MPTASEFDIDVRVDVSERAAQAVPETDTLSCTCFDCTFYCTEYCPTDTCTCSCFC